MFKLFKKSKDIANQNVDVLTDSLSNTEFWTEPDIVFLAYEIATDFGKVLMNNSWMFIGAPESLLNNLKKDIILSFEILHLFLENNTSQQKFIKKYPDAAKTIINNNFYSALYRCVQFIELFISDENVIHSVNYARLIKENKKESTEYFLKYGEIINRNNKSILEKTAELLNYFNSKGLFIKNKLFN